MTRDEIEAMVTRAKAQFNKEAGVYTILTPGQAVAVGELALQAVSVNEMKGEQLALPLEKEDA